MIYLQLFASFFKIGLFSFGGGYGMIPLIERELQVHGWLSSSDLVNVISISEMTPGPIAVNTATFVGYKVAGIIGGAIATTGVALPSLILIIAVSHFLYKYKSRPLLEKILYGIKPVVLTLIIVAIIFMAKNTLFTQDINIEALSNINSVSGFFSMIDLASIAIMIISIIMLALFKIHPILVILASGVIGVILYYLRLI